MGGRRAPSQRYPCAERPDHQRCDNLGWSEASLLANLLHMETMNTPVPDGLIQRLGRLAWDVDFTQQTLVKYPEWTLQRVLEYGQWEDYQALAAFWGERRMREILSAVHCTQPRARSFCEVLCA